MSLAVRRILYLSFIGLFFVITTLVFSYANGYSLNFSTGQLIKTGMFAFDTNPPGAQIFLNDELQSDWSTFGSKHPVVTPNKIKNLLPGEYNIRLELAGYHTWQKKLFIRSGEATFAETVHLFKKNEPLLVEVGQVNMAIFSPDHTKSLLIKDNEAVLVVNELGRQESEIAGRFNSGDIAASGGFVRLDNIVYETKSSLPYIEIAATSTALSDVFFSTDEDLLIYRSKNSVASINLSTKTSKTVPSTSSSRIVGMFAGNEVKLVNESGKINVSYGDESFELPNDHYNFSYIGRDLFLLTGNTGTSFICDISKTYPVVGEIKNVRSFALRSSEALIYTTDHEIFDFDLKLQSSKLITRLAEPINYVFWHASNNYIVYVTDKNVYSLELDEREKRSDTLLYSFDNIDFADFDPEMSTLYLTGSYNKLQGFYKMEL